MAAQAEAGKGQAGEDIVTPPPAPSRMVSKVPSSWPLGGALTFAMDNARKG